MYNKRPSTAVSYYSSPISSNPALSSQFALRFLVLRAALLLLCAARFDYFLLALLASVASPWFGMELWNPDTDACFPSLYIN